MPRGGFCVAEAPIAASCRSTGGTGLADPGLVDPGLMDTGLADTGLADTGLADTGLADTGLADTVRSPAPVPVAEAIRAGVQ